jgi:hypothetical protein
VAKKRLDLKVGFNHAVPTVRVQLDDSCQYLTSRTRRPRRVHVLGVLNS